MSGTGPIVRAMGGFGCMRRYPQRLQIGFFDARSVRRPRDDARVHGAHVQDDGRPEDEDGEADHAADHPAHDEGAEVAGQRERLLQLRPGRPGAGHRHPALAVPPPAAARRVPAHRACPRSWRDTWAYATAAGAPPPPTGAPRSTAPARIVVRMSPSIEAGPRLANFSLPAK